MLRASRLFNNLLTKNAASYGITPQFMHPLTAELLLDEFPKTTKRTKTICTIGYSSHYVDLTPKAPIKPVNSLTQDLTWLVSTFLTATMLSTTVR